MIENPPGGLQDGDEIDAYVAANRSRFTPAALRERLLSAGHPPTMVDAALSPTRAAGPEPRTIREAMSGSRYGIRGRVAVWIIRIAHVAMFFAVAWWYVGSMSGIGAIIAGVLLAFGLGIGFMVAMTAFGESARRLQRGNIITGVAAGVAAPLLVMIVLTGVCVGVSIPIDWVTGGV